MALQVAFHSGQYISPLSFFPQPFLSTTQFYCATYWTLCYLLPSWQLLVTFFHLQLHVRELLLHRQWVWWGCSSKVWGSFFFAAHLYVYSDHMAMFTSCHGRCRSQGQGRVIQMAAVFVDIFCCELGKVSEKFLHKWINKVACFFFTICYSHHI